MREMGVGMGRREWGMYEEIFKGIVGGYVRVGEGITEDKRAGEHRWTELLRRGRCEHRKRELAASQPPILSAVEQGACLGGIFFLVRREQVLAR